MVKVRSREVCRISRLGQFGGAQPGEVWVEHYCSKAAVHGDV